MANVNTTAVSTGFVADFQKHLTDVTNKVANELQTLNDSAKKNLIRLDQFADDVFNKVPELETWSKESLQKFSDEMVSVAAMATQAAARAKAELDKLVSAVG